MATRIIGVADSAIALANHESLPMFVARHVEAKHELFIRPSCTIVKAKLLLRVEVVCVVFVDYSQSS